MTATAIAERTIFASIPVALIRPSPLNPRKHFDPEKLNELAATMGNGVGVIEPLVVREQIDVGRGRYELVAGERRWRAATIAGLDEVPAVVKSLTDAQVLEIMVIENDQREDVNPLEEGDGFKRLMTFGFDIDRLASRIGRSRKYIYDRVKLLDLIEPARDLLLAQRISAGHAILIARLTPDQQRKVLKVEKRNGYGSIEGPLFEHEDRLWDPAQPHSDRHKQDPYAGLKLRSVRELEAYIDTHCRFDAAAPVSAELFPATTAAVEEAEKVISITHNHQVHPDAKDGNSQRIYSVVSWKRADGEQKSKACAKSVTGVIVVGYGRGEAFRVCVNKDCDTHWGAEKRAKAKAATSTSAQAKYKQQEEERQKRYKREQEARERQEKAWSAARPEIFKAVAAKVRSIPIASVITDRIHGEDQKLVTQAAALLDLTPTVPEEALRILMLVGLLGAAERSWSRDQFIQRTKKRLGIDVAAIMKTATKAQTSAPQAKADAKKPAASKVSRKKR